MYLRLYLITFIQPVTRTFELDHTASFRSSEEVVSKSFWTLPSYGPRTTVLPRIEHSQARLEQMGDTDLWSKPGIVFDLTTTDPKERIQAFIDTYKQDEVVRAWSC